MAQVDVRSQAVPIDPPGDLPRPADAGVDSPRAAIGRRFAAQLGRWPVALLACFLLAAAVLLPRLGSPGLWEPQERQLADRIAPPVQAASKPPAKPDAAAPAAGKDCSRSAPADAAARTLTNRAMVFGRDAIADSDLGRRLPLAMLGLFTVLAAAGTAMRLAGARAGIVTAIVLLAMPLLALQSRMLTSEIGTACGAALIIYGLVALGHLRRPVVLDATVAAVALAAGLVIGFYGGGALLGLAVPIGAIALAGGLGVPSADGTALPSGSAAGRGQAPSVDAIRRRAPLGAWLPALVATLAAFAVLGVLASQLYDLKTPYPGMTPPPARALLGKAILPTGCYSWALGGVWRPEDDLKLIFDSSFEQIAYGTYPWGLLAPIAIAALLADADPQRKRLGAVTLAWAAAAWLAGEAFQRKVGFTIYAGFPALAIAVGAWLDGVLTRRARGEGGVLPAAGKLIALFAVLAAIDIGKDMQSFAERLTSLLIGSDGVPYPTKSTLVFLPTKLWVLIFGAVIAISFALALTMWRAGDQPRERWHQRFATRAAITAIGATILLAAFWPAIWQPRLADNLSSKGMFESYQALAKPGDELVVMGDLGQAPFAYSSKPPQLVPDRSQIITALGRPNRVFAIAPQAELCTLHREIAGKPYFVVDDRNTRNLLLSNRIDGTTDKNPLRATIVHDEPKNIPFRPKGKVVWDNKIQLLGWAMPKRVARGSRFEVTLYYKILQPVGGNWKTLMHFDGPAGRAGNGDHDPIGGRCPTSTWQQGDYIIDTFTPRAGGGAFPTGTYDVWLGFFTGAAPNWKNMAISEAPGDLRDGTDRVKITTLGLE